MVTKSTGYYNRYKTPAERLMAAQAALRSTVYGMGNIIKADLQGDNVVFTSSVSGKVYTTIDEAIREVQPLHLTDVTSVSALRAKKMGSTTRGRRLFAGSKTSAAASMFSSVISQLKGSLNTTDLQLLRDAGIDVDSLIKNGNMDILTMHARKGESNVSQIAERIRIMREQGNLHGLTVVDDEGARVIQFRAGKNMLNSYQTNLLLTVTGHDMLDPDVFANILKGGDTGSLAKNLMKIPKRVRAFLAEREVSLAGGELSTFIGKHAKNLNDAFLVTDPQLDLLRKLVGRRLGNAADTLPKKVRAGDLDVYYGKIDPNQFLDQYLSKMTEKERRIFKDRIRQVLNSMTPDDFTGGFGSDAFKAKFIQKFSDQKELINQIFDTIEYGFDGSDLLNSSHLRSYRKSLSDERSALKALAESSNGKAKQEALEQISAIDRQIKSINLGLLNGDQVTGRGRIQGMGDIKTAFHITRLDKKFKRNYAGVISKFSLKGELGLMGSEESLILSGFGDLSDDILQGPSRGLVYADPVLTAFQPEYFADLETQKAIQGRIDSVIAEFQNAINNNVLPQKLKGMLEKSANEDLDSLAPHLRYSALRNRQFAREILQLHQSGVGPGQAPRMMNLLASMMASQAFREKEGFVQAVLADVYRFAIDTEAIAAGSRNINPILGTGYEKMGGIRDNVRNTVVKTSDDFVKFRVKGHKMMFAPGVIGNVRHALGGFDLDDKGLPKLVTFDDEKGIRRLGFNIFRQPSGPEEVIFGRMSMDYETIQALFGGDQFRTALDELITEQNFKHTGFNTLKYILNADQKDALISSNKSLDKHIRRAYGIPDSFSGPAPQIDHYTEQAIIDVYERLQERGLTRISNLSKKTSLLDRISQSGKLTSLRIEDVLEEEAKYTRQGIYKIMSQRGAFSLSGEMMQVLEENKSRINKSTYANMKTIIEASQGDFSLVMKELGNLFPKDPGARTIFSMAFQESARAAQESGSDILGLYVNRSMAVGTFLNQYEDILSNLKIKNNKAGQYMLKNFQIGLLSQETAIDLSINFSGARKMTALVNKSISESGFSLNVKGVQSAVNAITGQMGSLDDVGSQAISSLGKIIGAANTLEEVSDIGAGLDSMLLNLRLKSLDLQNLLEGMIAGAEEMQKKKLATIDAATLKDRIAEMKEISRKSNEEDIREYLLKTIGLVRGNKYASIANSDQRLNLEVLEAVRRSAIGRISRDETLSGFVANKETQAAAKVIMDRHADLMEAAYNQVDSSLGSLSATESFERIDAMQWHGTQLLEDISEAIKFKDVSLMDLVNEIDRISYGKKFDLAMTRAIFDESKNNNLFKLSEKIMYVRDIRRANYYQRMDELAGGLGSNVEQYLEFMFKNRITSNNLEKQSRKLLSSFTTGETRVSAMFDKTVEEVLMSLTGKSEDITDRVARAEADRIATLIRSNASLGNQNLTTLMQVIGKSGTMIDPSLEPDDSILGDIARFIDEEDADPTEVRNAVYKRFSDKFKENDFKRFLKSSPIRNTGLAVGALVLGSFAYSAYRDRTYEDAQGPPLLPGGSAYEDDYPFRVPEIGSFSGQGYNPGMNYQVSINGSQQDIDRFNSELSGLTNTNINTTMYDRAPNLSRNPLVRIMEAF